MYFFFLLILEILVKVSAKKTPSRGELRVYKGGTDTHNEFPFAVVLQKKNPPSRFCTGSLIAHDWVLTAAHCVPSSMLPGHMVIRYGEFTKPANETKLYSNVIKTYAYPNHVEQLILNDIGIIFIQKIPTKSLAKLLALDYKTFFGLHVKYAGFGHFGRQYDATAKENRESAFIPLQIGEGIVVPCAKNFYVNVLCIAPKCSNRKQQVRPGDSGGPLVYDGRVIGVGRSAAFGDPTSHYTPVSPYLEWIQNTIRFNEN